MSGSNSKSRVPETGVRAVQYGLSPHISHGRGGGGLPPPSTGKLAKIFAPIKCVRHISINLLFIALCIKRYWLYVANVSQDVGCWVRYIKREGSSREGLREGFKCLALNSASRPAVNV